METDRRHLITTTLGGLLAAGTLRPQRLLAAGPTADGDFPSPAFPAQDPDLVRTVVGASHFDLDRVRQLVEPRPELARAAWDWGFGDWETALGAASHTGRADIVEVLVANGARADLFTHAMLGHLDVVRATIEASPGIQSIPGPHGLTLLHHARVGEERAAKVRDYLERLGGADPTPTDLPLDAAIRERLIGRYRGGDLEMVVEVHRLGPLALAVGDGAQRMLFHQGDLAFHPAGAPSVSVRFDPAAGKTRLAIHTADGDVAAERLGDRSE